MRHKEDKAKHDRVHACINFLITFMPAAIITRVLAHFYHEMSDAQIDIAISCSCLTVFIIMIKILIIKYKSLIGYTPNIISAITMIVMMEDAIQRSPT